MARPHPPTTSPVARSAVARDWTVCQVARLRSVDSQWRTPASPKGGIGFDSIAQTPPVFRFADWQNW
jgi:hypothetical protein